MSRDKFPKKYCKCELVGFRCLEKLGSEIHFSKIHLCFENQSAILLQDVLCHKLAYFS